MPDRISGSCSNIRGSATGSNPARDEGAFRVSVRLIAVEDHLTRMHAKLAVNLTTVVTFKRGTLTLHGLAQFVRSLRYFICTRWSRLLTKDTSGRYATNKQTVLFVLKTQSFQYFPLFPGLLTSRARHSWQRPNPQFVLVKIMIDRLEKYTGIWYNDTYQTDAI